jgi:hypothetical protein
MPFVCSLLIQGLLFSPVVQRKLPKVRRLALLETIQAIANDDNTNNIRETIFEINKKKDIQAVEIVLQNLDTSPYLNEEEFVAAVFEQLSTIAGKDESNESDQRILNNAADAIFVKDWERLLEVARDVRWNLIPERTNVVRLCHFRHMVIEMFSRSRQIKENLNDTRRGELGKAIHEGENVDDLIKVAKMFLASSNIFKTDEERKEVLNLIKKGRFDQLLLPKYFDCEEKDRRIENQEPEECPCVICFDDLSAGNKVKRELGCKHVFCRGCIDEWLKDHRECPTCRTPVADEFCAHLG